MSIQYQCDDFSLFQESLKKMRVMDDKIIYALNTSLPTESFRGQQDDKSKTCEEMFTQLQKAHNQRDESIKKCILVTAEQVKTLKDSRESQRDDITVDKKFKAAQKKLRILQSEMNVEDIIKERTFKVFNEKCRFFFNIEAFSGK